MPRRLAEHIYRHPWRLTTTVIVIVVGSWVIAGIALVHTLDASHQGRVENCRAVNELSRKIFTTGADLGIPLHERLKFIPTKNCENLP